VQYYCERIREVWERPAGEHGRPCYHAAAALGVHMGLVRVKRAASDERAVLVAPAPRKRVERVGPFVN
jgi:hypothetical protein